MSTTETGIVRGNTIELEHEIPEMNGQRVRVLLEPFEELLLSPHQQTELWRDWIKKGPQGPIEDDSDTAIP